MSTPDPSHDLTPVDGHFVPIDDVDPGCENGHAHGSATDPAHDHHDHTGHYHPDLSKAPVPRRDEGPVRPRVDVWDLLRFLSELFWFATLCVWGFVTFPLPWNIVAGIGAPVLAILVWALFRSPRAVFNTDTFGKAIAEVVIVTAAAFAWWDMGNPVIAVIAAIVGLVIGIVVGRRELHREAELRGEIDAEQGGRR